LLKVYYFQANLKFSSRLFCPCNPRGPELVPKRELTEFFCLTFSIDKDSVDCILKSIQVGAESNRGQASRYMIRNLDLTKGWVSHFH